VNVLDELVPPFDGEPGDWEDVLRRARRLPPRRRLVLAAAAVVAPLAAASAVAVPLLVSDKPQLPPDADLSKIAVILEPRTGHVTIKVAPWRGHRGVCILVVGRSAGCFSASRGGPMVIGTRRAVPDDAFHTFDRRVVALKVTYVDYTTQRFRVHRFGARLYHVGIFGPFKKDKLVLHGVFIRAKR
jgi:hypothetical protein